MIKLQQREDKGQSLSKSMSYKKGDNDLIKILIKSILCLNVSKKQMMV